MPAEKTLPRRKYQMDDYVVDWETYQIDMRVKDREIAALKEEIIKWKAEEWLASNQRRRYRNALISLLDMPAACTTEEQVIENVKRRQAAKEAL